jgi:hypothetical protein
MVVNPVENHYILWFKQSFLSTSAVDNNTSVTTKIEVVHRGRSEFQRPGPGHVGIPRTPPEHHGDEVRGR